MTNEETLFLSVYKQLLAEGEYPEEDIEEMAHKILDNPEDYPHNWYFWWANRFRHTLMTVTTVSMTFMKTTCRF